MKNDYLKIIKDIDIVDELDNLGITGKKTGNNFMICCPYHNESNPSLGVAINGEKKGLFNCFSCGEKGTLFHLISFLEDKKIEDVITRYTKSDIDIATIKDMKNIFIKSFKKKEKDNKIKIIDKEILKKFKDPYGKFFKYLNEERKLDYDDITKFNILCCYRGKWKGRIVVPIFDYKNRLISLEARKIYENDKTEKVRKLKDTDRKKVLFGLNHIKHKKKLILVEGVFDCIYLQKFDIPAVAIGTVIPSDYQIKKLIHFCDKVVISLDGDIPLHRKNGVSINDVKRKLTKYINVSIIKLKDNKDPNELNEKEVKKYYGPFN